MPIVLEIKPRCGTITPRGAMVEPEVAKIEPGNTVQFERQGYFCPDSRDWSPERLVFNRTVTLRDSWAKIAKKG